jgi:hypothetical protein
MFRFLKCCCDIICPPCPYPNANIRGSTSRPTPSCPQCPGCPPCPAPYQNQVGYTDGAFDPRCPRCPKCSDISSCWRNPAFGEIGCPCVPTRYEVTLVGVNFNCSCFENICPHGAPNPNHNESSGSCDGSYCGTPNGGGVVAGNEKQWGNDGPTCGAPATLINEGFSGTVGFVYDGLNIVITAFSPLGNTVFRGQAPAPCRGAIVIPNTVSGCKSVCPGDVPGPFGGAAIEIITSSGGYAIVTPCGC